MAEPEESVLGRVKRNMGHKLVWEELGGSVGDLGTFVPIVLALVLVNGLDLGTTLVFTGAYNVVTGLLFGVPMPVQPMKSIAAVAITEGDPLSLNQIMAAGLSTALVLAILGITGLMSVVNRLVPLPVVRGVQLSQGIAFGITAVKYILKEQDLTKGKTTGDRPWLGMDGLVMALSALCFIVLTTGAGGGGIHECGSDNVGLLEGAEDESITRRERRMREGRFVGLPTALLVFIVGVLLAIARDPGVISKLHFGPSIPHFLTITKEDWKIGFMRAAIPQLPLSILNSVIAVCKLSNDLFPSKDVSPFKVSVSVGLMNLVGCWWGAMPVCHGAGGLAGQYRFGAKTGMAVVFLGSAKMFLGLVFGTSLVGRVLLLSMGCALPWLRLPDSFNKLSARFISNYRCLIFRKIC
uniref:Molybdate transporter 1 n=1 Tax=Physcomitrium patens TaxID=3218 RepID=A0A7I4D179_PHYPA